MTRAAARGHHAWVEARRTSDFAVVPPLPRATNVELKRRYVECFEWSDSPYTPLLDDYEPGMTTTEVREVFAVLRPALTELVARRARGRRVVPPRRRSTPEAQRAFAERVLATLGFDDGAWRLDPTAHPFCTSFSNRDVRLTTRYRPDDLESVWSTLHEAGHGLYAHGIADALAPLAARTARRRSGSTSRRAAPGRTSSGAAGRSGTHWYEPLQETFPTARRRRARRRSCARSTAPSPGLIRVDADETTYSLHIILRFELEQELIDGHGRARGPARDLERADEGVPRRRRAATTATACCRTSTGRAAGSATSRRTRSAT